MKTKSLLISYSGYPTSPHAFMPDNGLAVLAGSLLANGHETTILDYSTIDIMDLLPPEYGEKLLRLKQDTQVDHSKELREISNALSLIQEKDIARKAREITGRIVQCDIDFLAFKLWTGKGFENAIKLASEIKKINHRVPIFAGGSHVDYFRERIYTVTDIFDALVYGEGEETIVDLADYVLGKKQLALIPNLIFKKSSTVIQTPEKRLENLDISFPIYDTDTYPALKGDKKIKLFISEFSRGCPFRCNFCGHSNKSGSVWRCKSAERIKNEFRYVINTHGTRIFRNGDSNTPGPLLKNVAEKLMLDGLDIEYALISHVNNLNPDDFALLKRSGCFSIFFGIESGNQHIIDNYINKGLKLERVKKIIKECKKNDLFVVTSFVYPCPGDTENSKKDTFNFIRETKPDTVNVCTPVVTPRSTWGDNPGKYNIELSENYFDELMFFTPALFFPPTMWKPLNYKINGNDFFEIANESDCFAASLEKENVLTQVMDDVALMAKHCCMDSREFRDKVRHYLSIGDQQNMSALIEQINRSAATLQARYIA